MTTRTRWLVHPGGLLREELEARNITQLALARQIGRPVQVINEVCREKKAVTARLALELEQALGISADFWMNLQSQYELAREQGAPRP